MNFAPDIEGVQGHVTGFTITDLTKPSSSVIVRWMEQYDASVAFRLGPLDVFVGGTADEAVSIRLAAAKLVELATAADTIDAAYPERTTRINTDLGNVLRTRYQSELDGLVKMVTVRRDAIIAGDTAGAGTSGSVAFSFPATLVGRKMMW